MKSLDETSQIFECSAFLIIFVILFNGLWIKKRVYRTWM